MPEALISPEHITPFAEVPEAQLQGMLDDVLASAYRYAPALEDTEDPKIIRAARAILRRAVLRWIAGGVAGSRSSKSETMGPFNQSDTVWQTPSSDVLTDAEITSLQALFAPAADRGAFMVNMTGIGKNLNPLAGAVINSGLGTEPMGVWADETLDPQPDGLAEVDEYDFTQLITGG